jgi:hypothetical protein
MRQRGRPTTSNIPRTAQLRAAQVTFRKQMKRAGFWSFQAYLPAALVQKIDEAKGVNESRGVYLTRVLAPIYERRSTASARQRRP